MSDSVRPHRWQPTRLPHPWDSPGKHTGVGCHFLLQCMKVKSESEVAQSCPTPSNPMNCSLPGSSVHGICQVHHISTEIFLISHAERVVIIPLLIECKEIPKCIDKESAGTLSFHKWLSCIHSPFRFS